MNLSKMSEHELDDLIADANAILNSKGFQIALEALKQQYVQELLEAPVGSLTATSAHASMKVADDFMNHIKVIINEGKFRGNNVRTR